MNESLTGVQRRRIEGGRSLLAYLVYDEDGATIPSRIMAYDAVTYEQVCSIDIAELDQIDPSNTSFEAGFTSDPEYLYVIGHDKSAAKGLVVYTLSARTGSIIATAKLAGIDAISFVDVGKSNGSDPSPIVIGNSSNLYVVDTLSGDVLLSGSSYTVESARYAGSVLALCTWGALFGNSFDSADKVGFGLVDIATGKIVHSDVEDYIPASYTNSKSYVLDSAYSRMAVCCSDGALRMFSMPQGNLTWEIDELSSDITFMTFCNADSCILLQDASGRCALVDAENGTVLATSPTTYAKIQSVIDDRGEDGLLIHVDANGTQAQGLALLRTDASSFGISGLYPNAHSLNAESLLLYDDDSDSFYTLPRYSLDELIDMGRDITREYELTGAQRLQFRID